MNKLQSIPYRPFLIITIGLILIKSVIGFMMFRYENDRIIYKLEFKQDFGEQYSGDEFEIVRSALYYNQYGKIMADSPFHSFGRPRVREEGLYLTAFRPKAQIMNHVLGLRLTEALTGKKISSVAEIPHSYLHYFGLMMCILKTLLFPVSVWFVYKTLNLLLENKLLVQTGTWAYILIPSVFIFIGWFDTRENVALYCFLANFYFVLGELMERPMPRYRFLLMPVLTVVSALSRPHLLIFYTALYGFLLVMGLLRSVKKQKPAISFSALLCFTFLFLCHLPILSQNNEYFGKHILSTQSKFEFFQGHNPFARGSWYPAVYMNNKTYFDSVFSANPLPFNANELEEAEYYQRFSLNWIAKNPMAEAELIARKIAGYFLPWNFINHRINIFSILLHISFFVFCFRFLKTSFLRGQSGKWSTEALLMVPALMSILLTVVFFTGERWRYFAEPFFLFMGLMLIDGYLKKKERKSKVLRDEPVQTVSPLKTTAQ